jgi:hypothetical protein
MRLASSLERPDGAVGRRRDDAGYRSGLLGVAERERRVSADKSGLSMPAKPCRIDRFSAGVAIQSEGATPHPLAIASAPGRDSK